MTLLLRNLRNTLKRICKKPLFAGLLLLFPLLTVLFLCSGSDENRLCVALYTESESGFSHELTQNLLSRDGVYHFYLADSEDDLQHDVLSGYAECGYIFPDQLLSQLDAGRKKNLVELIVSSNTTMDKITNEIVYSEIFALYAVCILDDYLADTLPASPDPQEVHALYNEYMTNGSTFAFDFTDGFDDYSTIKQTMTSHMLIGLIGLLILLGSFSGLLQYADDEQKKRLEHVPFSHRKYIAILQILCPLMLFLCVGVVCLAITGYFQTPLQVLYYLRYGMLVFLLCLLMYPLRRFRLALLTMLPVYLLGCLVFTPVFIDISLYLPKLSWLSHLFITDYLF